MELLMESAWMLQRNSWVFLCLFCEKRVGPLQWLVPFKTQANEDSRFMGVICFKVIVGRKLDGLCCPLSPTKMRSTYTKGVQSSDGGSSISLVGTSKSGSFGGKSPETIFGAIWVPC